MTRESSRTGLFYRFDASLPSLLSSQADLGRLPFSLLASVLGFSVWSWLGSGLPLRVSALILLLATPVAVLLAAKRLRNAGLPPILAWVVAIPIIGWLMLIPLATIPTKAATESLGWQTIAAVLAVLLLIGGIGQTLRGVGVGSASNVSLPAAPRDGDTSTSISLEPESASVGEETLPLALPSREDLAAEFLESEARFEAGPGEVTDIPLENVYDLTLRIEQLLEAPERPDGYDRDLFQHWIDADGNGCDTRKEVLVAESETTVVLGPSCAISGGRWTSVFDGLRTDDPADLDVDHFVPLKEAWSSGAHSWDRTTRQLFANDLGFAGSLVAVSSSANRSKGAKDPASWLPPEGQYACQYVQTWVEIKIRWDLSADADELAALRRVASDC